MFPPLPRKSMIKSFIYVIGFYYYFHLLQGKQTCKLINIYIFILRMKRELFDRNVFITCDGDRGGKKGEKKGKKGNVPRVHSTVVVKQRKQERN